MGSADVWARYHIPAARIPQIAGFTGQSMRMSYQGAIRNIRTHFGYDDKAIVLRDETVLNEIANEAMARAQAVVDGYNTRLEKAIRAFVARLGSNADTAASDQEYEVALRPFMDSIQRYNREHLIPNQANWSIQKGIHDFISKNGIIPAGYLVFPPTSTSPDGERCQRALDISNASGEKGSPLINYDNIPPRPFRGVDHPNCPHLLVPGSAAAPESLPSWEKLWSGDHPTYGDTGLAYDLNEQELGDVEGFMGEEVGSAAAKSFLAFAAMLGIGVQKFNPNHDERGRFSTSMGAAEAQYASDQNSVAVDAYEDDAKRFLGLTEIGTVSSMLRFTPEYDAKVIRALSAKSGLPAETVYAYIGAWLSSAKNLKSIAVTEAARQMWHLPTTPQHDLRVDSLLDSTPAVDEAKRFLTAQYDLTQSAFASLGYQPDDTIDLYRGFSRQRGSVEAPLKAATDTGWSDIAITQRPLSSWTSSLATSTAFANDNMVAFIAHLAVPVKDIVATGFTGMGQPIEREFVIRGGHYDAQVARFSRDVGSIWRQKFNPNHDERGRFVSGPGGGAPITGPPPAWDDPKYADDEAAETSFAEDVRNTLHPALIGTPYDGGDAFATINGHDTQSDYARRGATIAAASGGTVTPDAAAKYIEAWNSGAQQPLSVILTDAAQRLWSTPSNAVHGDRIANIQQRFDGPEYAARLDAATQFLKAQYAVTQRQFATLGYAPTAAIDLYRGFGREVPDPALPREEEGWQDRTITTRPLTSWTNSPITATSFNVTSNPYIAHIQVPITQIVATGFTGLGTITEQEFVLRGGQYGARVAGARGDLDEIIKRYTVKFNPNHDPQNGEFSSGGGLPSTSVPAAIAADTKAAEAMLSRATAIMDTPETKPGENPSVTTIGDMTNHQKIVLPLKVAQQLTREMSGETDEWSDGYLNYFDLAYRQVDNWLGPMSPEPENVGLAKAVSEKFTIPMGIAQSVYDQGGVSERSQANETTVLDTVYSDTQQFLADSNITSMQLSRGIYYTGTLPVPADLASMEVGDQKVVTFEDAPLSAWSIEPSIAERYADKSWRSSAAPSDRGFILSVNAPSQRIISTPVTGPGKMYAGEVLMAGGRMPVLVKRVK